MRRALTLGILAAGGLVLAGCGGVDQDAIAASALQCPEGSECYDVPEPIGPGGEFSIDAGDLFFENLEGTAIDGTNTVTIANIGAAEHNIRIDQAAGENKKVTALGGETTTGELQLFAGSYTYYCDIPGHRSAGMEGQITVYVDQAAADEAVQTEGAAQDVDGVEPRPQSDTEAAEAGEEIGNDQDAQDDPGGSDTQG